MIEFDKVSKTYPDGTTAVIDVSLTIPSREIVVLLGSSGCGKTTLLRMVNRIVDPTSGSVRIDGEDVRDLDPVQLRRSIGYVLQEGGLLPHRTVADNVATVPMLRGTSKRQARAAVGALMERVGLDPALGRRYPSQLSGGQRQRVGVARALATDPNILLMDEPFGAVDPIVRRELQTELIRLQRELGTTILLVTHDVDEAFRIGHQVAVIAAKGEIAHLGTPAQIMANPANEFVRDFIGADSRHLRVRSEAGQELIVDEAGRPVGVLRR